MSDSHDTLVVTKSKQPKARQQIIDGLIKALSDSPDTKPTVKAVITAAGVTRSTFYVHFDSVNHLIQCVIDEFVHHAEIFLLDIGTDVLLVDMLTRWFDFCRDNRQLYIALSDAKASGFTETITDVWSRHLVKRQDHEHVPKDMFRAIHSVCVPRSNEYMTYAWLTKPELSHIPAKILAQIINNRRLNYIAETSIHRRTPRIPLFSGNFDFISSEIVAITRMYQLLRLGKEGFIYDNFTSEEVMQAEKSALSLYFYAQLYAAKRAITYCICGRVDEKLFRDISVVIHDRSDSNAVDVTLTGRAAIHAADNNINRIRLSTCYDSDYAAAFVIATL